ncbi:SRPBCC domain-containing protein [Microbacterium sp. TWP3-1-2b2]|uniref:SRPBCC domain-containing protein n=1 Tax=Microbacterium sp. TWP3-1-2b2 TaxID=2804651 RepID=UPI003CF434F9
MTLTGRVDSARHTLVLTRHFTTSIDDVWESIADSDRLSRWFGTWSGDSSTGTVSVTMNAEAEPMPAVPYEIRRCEPPTALSVRVTDEYGTWSLTAELSSVDGTTTLVLTQEDVDSATLEQTGPGWEWYLDRLVAAVHDERMPTLDDFDTSYMPMSKEYAALAR